MKTTHSSDVIQGDEQCRDGHHRAKQDLRTKTVTSVGGEPAAELDPGETLHVPKADLARNLDRAVPRVP